LEIIEPEATFLQSFVNEIQNLITHGVTINGIIYPFKIKILSVMYQHNLL